MDLSPTDRLAIADLISLHGHLVDSGRFDRMGELFTDDVEYDVTDFGGSVMVGLHEGEAAARALGDANPLGHHVTNIVITADGAGRAHAVSKFIGVRTDGTTGTGTYDDTLLRGDEGWRISRRVVRARRVPLQP